MKTNIRVHLAGIYYYGGRVRIFLTVTVQRLFGEVPCFTLDFGTTKKQESGGVLEGGAFTYPVRRLFYRHGFFTCTAFIDALGKVYGALW